MPFYPVRLSTVILLCLTTVLFSKPVQSQSETNPIWTAGISQQIDFFSDVYDEQFITQFTLISEFDRSTWIANINRGFRFDQWGTQFELETYPKFGEHYYGHFMYAWSPDDIFPVHRAGAEIFRALPYRSEASVGIRYLDFRGDAQSWILTGSLTHYWEQYMFTLRPYFTFTDSGSGQTITLLARRFFDSERSYIQLLGGFGTTTEDILLQLGDGVILSDNLLLKSQQLIFTSHYYLTGRWHLRGEAGIIRQELRFDPGTYVNNYRIKAGIFYTF